MGKLNRCQMTPQWSGFISVAVTKHPDKKAQFQVTVHHWGHRGGRSLKQMTTKHPQSRSEGNEHLPHLTANTHHICPTLHWSSLDSGTTAVGSRIS